MCTSLNFRKSPTDSTLAMDARGVQQDPSTMNSTPKVTHLSQNGPRTSRVPLSSTLLGDAASSRLGMPCHVHIRVSAPSLSSRAIRCCHCIYLYDAILRDSKALRWSGSSAKTTLARFHGALAEGASRSIRSLSGPFRQTTFEGLDWGIGSICHRILVLKLLFLLLVGDRRSYQATRTRSFNHLLSLVLTKGQTRFSAGSKAQSKRVSDPSTSTLWMW